MSENWKLFINSLKSDKSNNVIIFLKLKLKVSLYKKLDKQNLFCKWFGYTSVDNPPLINEMEIGRT